MTLLVGLAGCGGNEESKPSTTAAGEIKDNGGEQPTAEDTIPTSTVPDDEFADVVEGLNAQFDSAPDSCGLLSVIYNAGSLPTPANAEQTKAATELLASVFRRLSESPPAGQEANGPVLSNAADGLIAEGEASNWDPSTIANASSITEETQNALGAYAMTCPELTGGATPEGAPAG